MKLLSISFLPAGCWLTRWSVRLLLAAILSFWLAISVVSAQTNAPFTGFTQSFDPSVSLITLTPYPGAGLYRVGDSIGIQTSNNTPIRVMSMDGSLVYSGAVTTLSLPVGHYFVETPGDRTQFVVLPGDYGNLDMLSTDTTGVWGYLDTINNTFAGTWERFGGGNEWEQVQTQSNTWNWGTTDARIAVVTATGRKIVYLGAANTTPSWLDTNSSQYVQNLVTGYTNFMTAAIARYGTNIYAWEIFNEPSLITLRLGTNWNALTSTFLALAQGAKAVRDQVAPWIKLVGPSWNSVVWTTPYNQWLHDHGIDDILDLWCWHDYDSNAHAPDQDYPNEIPPCEPLNHRLADALGASAMTKPGFVSETGLFGTSALGCPPPNPADPSIYQSGLSWHRGLCRAIKLAVMYRAQNIAGIDMMVGAQFANYPNSNLEIYGFDQPAGGSAAPRGPHPKTSAFLMTCYWLNQATYVDMRSPGTNAFLYAWRRADNTSMVVAWATEGSTVPVSTNSPFTATDIFGNSVTVNSLTETPVLFRSSSSDASTLLSNVVAALPSMDTPPVMAPLSNQNVLMDQLLQFNVSAADPNNDPITYSAVSLPSGASLDPTGGTFSWTPNSSQAGVYDITFVATDSAGLSASNNTIITVLQSETDGLIDWWKLDESSGTIAADSAGSNPGTLLGFSFDSTSGWVPGKIGNALAFDGTNAYVNLDNSSLSLSNNFSISVWMNPHDAANGDGALFCLRSAYGVSGFRIDVSHNGLNIGGHTTTGTVWNQTYFAANQIQNNTWYHVVVVYDKSNLEVYLNGVLLSPNYGGILNWGGDFVMNTNGVTRIGAEYWAFFFNGVIDDVRVYNRTLIPAEVLALYQAADQPPVLAPISAQTVGAGQPLAFTLSAADPDSTNLTFSAAPLPSGATLSPSTGAFAWTPTLSQTGSYSVTFSVTDSLLTSSQSASITVTGVVSQATDRPPVLAPVAGQNVLAGQSLTFTLSASDPDSSNLTYSANALPNGASLNAATGAFAWTPSNAQTGTYNVTFTVSDGQLTSSQAAQITVTLNVAPITVQVNPLDGGTVSGGGVYAVGSQAQVAAAPNPGWMFAGWNDGNTQNPRTITVRQGGASFTANLGQQPPSATVQINSGPSVTNAVLQVGGLSVVVADETNVFAVTATDSTTNTLFYAWEFGDGALGVRSSSSTAAHVFTNCGPFVAGVTVDDGVKSTNANVMITVACLLNITKVQATANFAKTNADAGTVKGSFDLPADYNFAGKLVTFNIGGAEVSFPLDSKGRGRNGTSLFSKPSYNKKTGLWTFNATLRGGSWQPFWAAYGLVNTTVLKPGNAVSLPVILVIDNDAFMQIPNLRYTSKAGKSGTAK